MKIALGADHAGWKLKEEIRAMIASIGHTAVDCGTTDETSVDYPDFAFRVADLVERGECERGVLCCGTGIGMSMAANKRPGIRAALCHDAVTAEFSRKHNDANILCLGARVLDVETGKRLTKLWLETPFDGGRHQRRVEKIG